MFILHNNMFAGVFFEYNHRKQFWRHFDSDKWLWDVYKYWYNIIDVIIVKTSKVFINIYVILSVFFFFLLVYHKQDILDSYGMFLRLIAHEVQGV